MAFEHNDIATKNRLMSGLGEELMGYEHNDIVTTDVMNQAIEEGGGGGGGDSDFSTAEVTVVIPWEFSEFSIEDCPTIQDNMCFGNLYVETSPAIVTVPLYKGKCYWAWSNSAVTITSGSAEPQGDGILITGNCTLTAED